MHKIDIADRIYKQMMQHFYCENGFLQEEVIGSRNYNLQQKSQSKVTVGLFDDFTEDIHSVLFTGIKRGVFESAKFDSKEGELDPGPHPGNRPRCAELVAAPSKGV